MAWDTIFTGKYPLKTKVCHLENCENMWWSETEEIFSVLVGESFSVGWVFRHRPLWARVGFPGTDHCGHGWVFRHQPLWAEPWYGFKQRFQTVKGYQSWNVAEDAVMAL